MSKKKKRQSINTEQTTVDTEIDDFMEEVDKAFCQFSDDYFQKGDIINADDSDYKPWLISDLVERNVGADVYVKHKKDGNVELFLKDRFVEDNCYTEVITDENNKPIITVLDLTKPMRSIKKQIYKFAQKCELFANCGNEEKALKQEDYYATHPEEWAA